MEELKDYLAARVPASFKDARMTLESVLATNALPAGTARAAAYAVAVSLAAKDLAVALREGLTPEQVEQAEVAAAIMGMTNVYYSFMDVAGVAELKTLPAQIRMVSYGQQAARDKVGFEVASLAVSIAGKCKPCIASHVQELQKRAFGAEQLRDIGRIAAAVNALAKAV